MDSRSEEIEIDLKELFFVLKKKVIIIILVAIAAGIATGAYCRYFITPSYESTSKLYILTKSTSVTSIADIQLGTALTADYMELIYSRPVVDTVIQNQKLKETYESLISKVEVENPADTRMLEITVIYDEPHTAKLIADEFAEVAKKRISKIMAMDEPSIVEDGYVNKNKAAPMTTKNIMIAITLGAVLSMGVIIVLHLLNDTIRSSDDVEKYLSMNVLTSIPLAKAESVKGKKNRKKKEAKEGMPS